ncbi:hypothetical protein MTO96_033230 [Rhipicephalus appendiculatus]
MVRGEDERNDIFSLTHPAEAHQEQRGGLVLRPGRPCVKGSKEHPVDDALIEGAAVLGEGRPVAAILVAVPATADVPVVHMSQISGV